MAPQHTNPSDAVLIHQEVGSKKSIGVHCCTFNLTTGAHAAVPVCLSAGLTVLWQGCNGIPELKSCLCCPCLSCLNTLLPNKTEALDEPPQLLQQAASEAGLAPDAFVTLQHGALLQTRDGVDANRPPLLPLDTTTSPAS
jgi:hypothetical protein